ncbi:hypothetical protein SAMN04515647_4204 [Cohaesibacter sp. ES.047]|uniref:hypothetical protein n=1 Tax=Cohaesibacter sp. ES.047 TaxID=1798205 RepID=UPI000BB92140|nr:hypothetical protein [Cohaesibacter sp. ES.047]SNY93883.1 hypothetical protein SAMN04515647_4204 [Cohaesibacter sp. ES.047]
MPISRVYLLILLLAWLAGFVVGAAGAAEARPAECYTSTQRYYSCDVKNHGSDGSFTITARGRPTITLDILKNGKSARGHIDFNDGRYRAMPGLYFRTADEPECWTNSASVARVCVWER